MSTAQIIAEFQKLKPEERSEVFEHLCQLQEQNLLASGGPSEAERRLLDEALEAYEQDRNPGIPWREAIRRMRVGE